MEINKKILIISIVLTFIAFFMIINVWENDYCDDYINATEYVFVFMEKDNENYICHVQQFALPHDVYIGINQEDQKWWWKIATII